MPFLTQGKTNIKYLLIVFIVAVIIGVGIFYYLQREILFYKIPSINILEQTETQKQTENYCEDSSLRDQCYIDLAKEERNEKICENITSDKFEKIDCYREMALIKNDETICDKIINKDPWPKIYCYFLIAVEGNNDNICDKLSNNDEKDSCYVRFSNYKKNSESCSKITNLDSRNNCYNSLALELRNLSLCEKIEDTTYQKNCKEHFIFDSLDWETYTNNKYGFEFKIPPLFVQVGYKITDEKSEQCSYFDKECDLIIFNLHPVEPYWSNSDKESFHPMVYMYLSPKEYCETEKGNSFCECLKGQGDHIKDEDCVFDEFISENNKFIVFEGSGSSSGDLADAVGWNKEDVQKARYQMLSTFKFSN